MYDPTIGQFISEDPIKFKAGDPNLRRYVGNTPTNATDPSGLVELPRISKEARHAIQQFVDEGKDLPRDLLDDPVNRDYLRKFTNNIATKIEENKKALETCTDPKMRGTYQRNIARQTNRLKNLRRIAPHLGRWLDGPLPFADAVFLGAELADNPYENAETVFSPRIDKTIEYVLSAFSFGLFDICGDVAKDIGSIEEKRRERERNTIVIEVPQVQDDEHDGPTVIIGR